MNDQNVNTSTPTHGAVGNDGKSPFEQRMQAALRESVEHLDGHTRSRLTQARHKALDAAKSNSLSDSLRWNWKWLAPLSATAAATVLAITLGLNPFSRPEQSASHSDLFADLLTRHFIEGSAGEVDADLPDKLEIIAAEDSLEFYRDVDFYAWLESELDENGEAAPAESAAIHEQAKV